MNVDEKLPTKIAQLTRFEKIALRISPRWAVTRYMKRTELAHMQRAYEAVAPSRNRKERNDIRSPDQIGSLSGDRLRAQARFLDENHDVARSVLDTLVSNVIGAGILSFPTVKLLTGKVNVPLNKRLMELHSVWAKTPDVTGEYTWQKCQQLSGRTWFRDGEGFSQLFTGSVPGLVHGSQTPLSIELMEPDFCPSNVFSDGNANSISKQVAPGNTVRQGIEKDKFKRPVAYYFWKDYPTELQTQFSPFLASPISATLTTDQANLIRVDADRVTHLKATDRIGQTRGVSIFASVYQRLDDLKDYEESERIAARVGAAFALSITKSIDGGIGTTSSPNWREMDLAPGIIADNLAPGEKIETIKNERPSNLVTDWRATQLRSVAGGTKAGYSSVSKEYDGSYSSQRQELMEQFVIYRMLRGEFVGQFIDPIWRNFVLMSLLAGLLDDVLVGTDMDTLLSAEHVGAGAPYIDPKKEVEADEKKVQAGFRARHQVVLDRGGNPVETQALIQAEREEDEAAGLLFSSTAQAAPTPTSPTSEEDAASEAEEDEEREILEGEPTSRTRHKYTVGRRYENEETGEVFIYTDHGFVKESKRAQVL